MSAAPVNPFTPAGLPAAPAPWADPASAASQWRAQAHDPDSLQTLIAQCEALLADTPPAGALAPWIDALWPAAFAAAEAAASRHARKPLPLADAELQRFRQSRRLWTGLALLCGQLATRENSPEHAALARQRAANALRMAVFTHVLAGHAVPAVLDDLVLACLDACGHCDQLASAATDPLLPALGQGSPGGYLAWACLWRLIEPQRFNMLQLNVLDRAFSRWRELARWQTGRGDDPKARVIDLSRLGSHPLPAGSPCWLDIRSLLRKLRQRSEALRQGELPEALKLGRELSASACLRLLRDVELSLSGIRSASATPDGPLSLVFGAEHAYALICDQFLNPRKQPPEASRLAHQRLGLFGFDRVSRLPGEGQTRRVEVPGETWQANAGLLYREAAHTPVRHAAGSLIASTLADGVRLGCLKGLEMREDGSLCGVAQWFAGPLRCAVLPRPPQDVHSPRQAAFLIDDERQPQIVLPHTLAVRLGQPLTLDTSPPTQVVPLEVLERGTDFVRYALRPAPGDGKKHP